MKVVELTHRAGTCPIYIGAGLMSLPTVWERHLEGRILWVSDETVAGLYGETLDGLLTAYPRDHLVLPPGEVHKTVDSWQRILDALVSLRADRDATVIALGGGVIGDLAGFAAAAYMRGIRVIQAPTTLLAQVDAAIGGKTGFNLPAGKNLVGAFHQPAAVIADLDTLNSLGEREYRAGLAEVVKYGAIGDADFLDWLEVQADMLNARLPGALQEAVYRAALNKTRVVSADETERGGRAILNFGHTFGHALEAATGYRRYLHGEAVAIGMVLAARLSELVHPDALGTAARLEKLLTRLGLPVALPGDVRSDDLIGYMRLDKKTHADQIRLVLLDRVGRARAGVACPSDDIRAVMTP